GVAGGGVASAGVGVGAAVGDGVGDGLGEGDGEGVGLAVGAGLAATVGMGAGDSLATTATRAGGAVPAGRLNPPRTARNPNDAATAASRMSVAPITAGAIGSRLASGGGGDPARR